MCVMLHGPFFLIFILIEPLSVEKEITPCLFHIFFIFIPQFLVVGARRLLCKALLL